MFRRCPSCNRLFQAKEIKREVLGAYEVQEPGVVRGITREVQIENFRVTFKCKNCGHEWTDVVQRG